MFDSFFSRATTLVVTFLCLVSVSSIPLLANPENGSLKPIFERIEDKGQGRFEVVFGYENKTGQDLVIPIGQNNRISPEVESGKHVTQFKKGVFPNQIRVPVECGQIVVWDLGLDQFSIQSVTGKAPECFSKNVTTSPNSGLGSCDDPKGWIEDQSGRTENNRLYWVPKALPVPKGVTPQTDPEKFNQVSCTFAAKIHYKNTTTGRFESIDNSIKPISQLGGSVNQNKQKEQVNGYVYANLSNDFQAYFPNNPNRGWKYTNDYGVAITVTRVSISGKPMVWDKDKLPIIEKNQITYPDILPAVDLQYVVGSEGVQKFFVLKSVEALTNDLQSISFELDSSNSFLIQKKPEVRQQIQELRKKRARSVEESGRLAKLEKDDQDSVVQVQVAGDKNNTTLIQKPITFEKGFSNAREEKFEIENGGKRYTIFPDLNILKSGSVEFPVSIDPTILGPSGSTKDTFVTAAFPTSARGTNNAFHIGVGGNACLNTGGTGCSSMGDTRSFLRFELPSQVDDASKVVSANLRLRQYANNGGAFRMRVRVACDFDELNMTWNTQACISTDRGFFDTNTTNTSCAGCGSEIWSSDIGQAVRDQVSSRSVKLALLDENEAATRGAAFCSKDGNVVGHPCNSGFLGPVLQIIYNQRPTKPNAITPNNVDISGGCDLSQNTGNCNYQLPISYRIENVNGGDNDCSEAYTRIVQMSNFTQHLSSPWYEHTGAMGPGCGPTYSNIMNLNGVYNWAAINRDNFGLESDWSDQRPRFIVDSSTPIRTGVMPGKEFSRNNQIELQAPEFGDNLINTYTIQYFGAGRLFSTVNIKPAGNLNSNLQALAGGNGSSLTMNVNQETNLQRWYIDNFLIRLEEGGRVRCLGISSGSTQTNGSSALVQDCNPSLDWQQWFYQGSGQIKSKRLDQVNRKELCLSRLYDDQQNGAQIRVTQCDANDPSQKWDLSPQVVVDRVIDADDSTNNVQLWTPLNNPNQIVVLESTGLIRFRSGLCLDSFSGAAESSRLYIGNCHAGTNQRFFYNPETKEIKMNNLNWCVNVPSGSVSLGNRLLLSACSGSLSQKWDLKKVEDSYRLTLKDRTKSLQIDTSVGYEARIWDSADISQQKFVYNASTFQIKLNAANTNICLEAQQNQPNQVVSAQRCDTSKALQKWVFDVKNRVQLKDTSLCLGVAGTSDVNDTRIRLQTCNDSWNQQFGWQRANILFGTGTQLVYNYQLSKEATFTNTNDLLDFGWQTSPVFQYPNDPNFAHVWLGEIKVSATVVNGSPGKNLEQGCIDSSCDTGIFGAHGGPQQKWIYTRNQEIKPFINTSMCLDAATVSDGGRIYVHPCHGGDNQKWTFENGVIKLKARKSGTVDMCLDVPSGDFGAQSEFRRVWLWPCNFGNAQKFNSQIQTTYNTVQYWLADGQKYFVRVRVKDRADGLTANVSNWNYYTPTEIDALSPKVDNFTFTNQVFVPFDKQSAAQKTLNIAKDTTVNFEVTDKNFDYASVFIYGMSTLNGYTNTDEATRILTSDGKTITQAVFNTKLVQARVEGGILSTRESPDGISWSNWVNTASGMSILPVQMVVFNGRLYQVATQSNNAIVVRSTLDNATWTSWVQVNGGTTTKEPSLVIFQDRLFLTTISTIAANAPVMMSTSTDGVTWSGWYSRGGELNQKVSQTVKDGKLYQLGVNDGQKIYIRSSVNGDTWTNWVDYDGLSPAFPTSVVYKGVLIHSVIGQGTPGGVHTRHSTDNGQTWTRWNYDGINSAQPAVFQVYQGVLYQSVFAGDNKLYQRSSTDGLNWTSWFVVTTQNDSNVRPTNTERQSRVVRTLSRCVKTGVTGTLPCNVQAFPRDANNKSVLSVLWDGKNDQGSVVADGVYQVEVKAYDKAGNESTNLSGNNFVTVDTKSNGVNLSYPKNGGFVNDPVVNLSGGLITQAGGNNNFDSLRVQKVDLDGAGTASTGYAYTPVTVNVNSIPNFVLSNQSLNLGTNQFTFETKDKLGNTQLDTYNVLYENFAPLFESISPTITTTEGGSSWTVNFQIKDQFPGSLMDRTSGVNLGTLPAGYDISLLRSLDNQATFQEIPLYRDGQPVSDPYSQTRLSQDLSCAYAVTTANTRKDSVRCSFTIRNPGPDGFYKLYIRIKDTAGNPTCSSNETRVDAAIRCDNNSFFTHNTITNIRSTYYNVVDKPETQTTVNNTMVMQGVAERGRTMSIRNTAWNATTSILLDPSKNNVLPREVNNATGVTTAGEGVNSTARVFTRNDSPFSITCGQFVDHDQNPQTPTIEACQWLLRVNLKDNSSPVGSAPVANTLTFNVMNNTVTRTVTVDVNSINVSSTPDKPAFSPNGDGNFDTIILNNKVTTTTAGVESPVNVDYRAEIRNGAGQLVWQTPAPDTLGTSTFGSTMRSVPATFVFDGKVNVASSTTNNHGRSVGSVLPDGTYAYVFRVMTATGRQISTTSTQIQLVNNLPANSKPIMVTPKNGFVTNKGVVSVQGIAPSSTSTNPWRIQICIDDLSTVQSCDIVGNVPVTTTGTFSALLSVPTTTLKQYSVSVQGSDRAGNLTPQSDSVAIEVVGQPNLQVTTQSDLGGINTPEQIQSFLNQARASDGKIYSLSDLRTATFSINVNVNTEAVDLDLIGNIDPDDTSVYGPDYNPTPIKRIASLNNLQEGQTLVNPTNDPTVRKDQKLTLLKINGTYTSGKDLGYLQKCTPSSPGYNPNALGTGQGGCTWKYTYILGQDSSIIAGTYQVRVRSYKGESILDQFTSFDVNGVKPFTPSLLKVEKEWLKEDVNCYKPEYNGSDACKEFRPVTKLYSSATNTATFYTNNNRIRFYGGADPDAKVYVVVKDGATTVAGATPDEAMTANSSGIFSNIITLPQIAVGFEKTYDLIVYAQIGQATTYSSQQFKLHYDRKMPTVNWVQTTNRNATNTFTTNPWMRGGDAIRFTVKSSEPVIDASVFNELSFECTTNRNQTTPLSLFSAGAPCDPESATNTTAGGISDILSPSGSVLYACSQFTAYNLKNNINVPYDCHVKYLTETQLSATLTLNSSTERVYYPSIYLQDLAGNQYLLTNNVSKQNYLVNLLKEIKPASSKGRVGETINGFNFGARQVVDADKIRGAVQAGTTNTLTTDELKVVQGDSVIGTNPLPSGYPYNQVSRGQSLDFTTFIDNSTTVKSTFDLTGWGSGIDGYCNTGVFPQADRLLTDSRYFNNFTGANATGRNCTNNSLNKLITTPNTTYTPQYVIRGNQIDLYAVIEKNQKVIMAYTYNNGSEVYQLLPATTQTGTCSTTPGTGISSDQTTAMLDPNNILLPSTQQLITKFKDTCRVKFTFTFPDDGKGESAPGRPSNNFQLSFFTVDLAGNLSTSTTFDPTNTTYINATRSNQVIVYHDTKAPENTQITNIKSSSYDVLPNFGSQTLRPITKDSQITISHTGEPRSDIQYQRLFSKNTITSPNTATATTTNPTPTLQATTYNLNTATGSMDLGHPIGGTLRDDDSTRASTCTTISQSPIKNRRVGTCTDGLYTYNLRLTDTSGNQSTPVTQVVERDTVSPGVATVTLTKLGDSLGNTNVSIDDRASITITGEENTRTKLEIYTNNSLTDTRNFVLEAGQYSNSDLLGKLPCGNRQYFVRVTLIDNAGNVSNTVTSSTITSSSQCPTCGANTLISPLKDSRAYIAFPYGYSSSYFNNTRFHTGVDYNGIGEGTPVYPTANGKVINAVFNFTNSDRGFNQANYVDIDHGSGLVTRYVHLRNEVTPPVVIGQSVTTDQVIGYVGNTGMSEGPHLHFTVLVNGKHENPVPYLQGKGTSVNTGNLNQAQRIQFGCVDLRGGIEIDSGASSVPYEGGTTNSGNEGGLNTPETTISNSNDPINTVFQAKTAVSESEWPVSDDQVRNGVNKNIRNIKFKVESAPNQNIIGKYDNKTEVWIVVHGWYKDPNTESYNTNYMECNKFKPGDTNCSSNTIASVIQANPNALVLSLDWREAAGSSANNFPTNLAANANEVYRAAKWIDPVARSAVLKLKSWGLQDASKLNFVSHSLGTLLSTEIAQNLGGANRAVLLDPPSQLGTQCGYICWGYDIDGNTLGNQSPGVNIDSANYYRKQFKFSRSFVGKNSVAGNQYLAPTSTESFVINFNSIVDFGDEHFRVIDVFNRINSDTKIYKNYLSLNDMNYSNASYNYNFGVDSIDGGFEGQLNVIQWDQTGRTWTESVHTRLYDFVNISIPRPIPYVYGTNQGTNIHLPWYGEAETHYYGSLGGDLFWSNKQSISRMYIHDFQSGDKLILDPYLKTTYKVVKAENYTTSLNQMIPETRVYIGNTRNSNLIIIEGTGASRLTESNAFDQYANNLVEYK